MASEIHRSQSLLDMDAFIAAEEHAHALTEERVNSPQNKQRVIRDVFCINLCADPSSEQLSAYYAESNSRSLNLSSLRVPARLRDGTLIEVPVSPATPTNIEDTTHHIVAFHRESDGAVAEVLVEDYSGYAVASRFIPPKGKATDWCYFGRGMLAKRFQPVKPTKYGPAYAHLDKVRLGGGIVLQMVNFLEKLCKKPQQDPTQYGRIMLATLYVLVSEGRRFWVIQEWNVANVQGFTQELLPRGFFFLVKKWLALSKCCYLAYLVILERRLLAVNATAALTSSDAKANAEEEWRKRQEELKLTGLVFYQPGVDIDLNLLAGGQLLLLRHDSVLCDKVLMRSNGYDGRWGKDILIESSEIPQDPDKWELL